MIDWIILFTFLPFLLPDTGFVHLQVFDDASHGFLNFSLIDPVSRKAVDSSIQLVKEAIAASKPL